MRSEDKSELSKIVSTIKDGYLEKTDEHRRRWGGGIMGAKSQAKTRLQKERADKELKI